MNKTLLPLPQNAMLTRSKLDTIFIYSSQSGPKDMITVQFHLDVKKTDEFLFSKSFHLRSVTASGLRWLHRLDEDE